MRLLAAACLVIQAGVAQAQLKGDDIRADADNQAPRAQLSDRPLFAIRVYFGEIDEDLFGTIAFKLSFEREDWGIGLALPIRGRLKDADPKATDDYLGFIRREDWDEPSDFLKLLRFAYLGQWDRRGPGYVRLGDLEELSLGHGSILYRYYNGFDVNRWHAGLLARGRYDALTGDVLVSDLVRLGNDASLVGGRVSARPLSLLFGDYKDNERLGVGLSFFADPYAPTGLSRGPSPEDLDGDGALGPGEDADGDGALARGPLLLDEHRQPVPSGRRVVGVLGADVEYRVVDEEYYSITPYLDVNKLIHGGQGLGLHLGVLWRFRFPVELEELIASVRTEYRRMSGDYESPYFGMLHELERYEHPPTSGTTKLEALRAARDRGGRNGLFLSLLAGMPKLWYVGADYIDRGPDDSTLRLSLQLLPIWDIELNAFYYRLGVQGAGDLFRLDDRTAVVFAVQVPVVWIFGVTGNWTRLWRPDPSTGSVQASDEWSAGVAISLKL